VAANPTLGGFVCFSAAERLTGPVLGAILRRVRAIGGWQDEGGAAEAEIQRWDAGSPVDHFGRWANPADPRQWLAASRLTPLEGRNRASTIHFQLANDTPSSKLAALAAWLAEETHLWWASLGHCFLPRPTWGFVLQDPAVQALARRYWGVQVIDPVLLQWDALRGLPGVNWLTLLGEEFVQAKGLALDAVAAGADAARPADVFRRRGARGLVLAAGPMPLLGDINKDENLGAYVRVASLLEVLTIKNHSDFIGPFAGSKLLSAWLARFADPAAWLDAAMAAADAQSAGFDEFEL
jgi:hypothetical protein